MAKDKKLVEAITAMEDDFAQWYMMLLRKQNQLYCLSVRGMYDLTSKRICDLGEYIQKVLDAKFKETGGKCCNANVHSRKPFKQRKRSCRGILVPRSCMGNSWWT